MLDYVAEVGSAGHSVGEPARLPRGAVVVAESGQHHDETLGEAGHVRGLPAGEIVEREPGDGDRPGGEDVGSA